MHQEAPDSGKQIKLCFSLFYLEAQHVPEIQLHIMALTQPQWVPEAKAFWMLQIMDEISPLSRYNSNWHLMNPLQLVCIGNAQMSLFISMQLSYGKHSEVKEATDFDGGLQQ